MYKNLLSVGGLTLVSRASGFLRDIGIGAVLGTGLLADAFFVAFKLPNHFRAIFGEGAFNMAYVPCYSQVLHKEGAGEARLFASRIAAIMLITQLVLLALALFFMPVLVDLLAPGFRDEPQKFDTAITLSRITFPYLLLITLVTLQSSTLNAHGRFVAAAFSPVLMNLAILAFLACAFLFPNSAVAACTGILVSGVLQLALTSYDAYRAGILETAAMPKLTSNIKHFFTTLGPAIIGSAGTQISIFADTIIGSLLPTGGLSSIYYADRIYQLPLGVIGNASSTVLLPEMSRLLALGEEAKAFHAQNRTMAISLALAAPFVVALIMLPDVIIRAVFQRGAFHASATHESAQVLMAYGFGLIAMVLQPPVLGSFRARADTQTPMVVALISVAVNVALKLVLFRPLGAMGIAFGTSAGAWIALILLTWIAWRQDSLKPDVFFAKTAGCVTLAAFILCIVASVAPGPILAATSHLPHFGYETGLLLICVLGGVAYALVLLAAMRMSGITLPLRLPRR